MAGSGCLLFTKEVSAIVFALRSGLKSASVFEARRSPSQRRVKGADSDAARVRAHAAYKDFPAPWKDAGPNIPILKQARAEYAKLQ